MDITLKPELPQFIEQQVKSGRFVSTVEAVEAGIARLMLDPESPPLDAEDLADIRISRKQMEEGQVIDWEQYSASLRKPGL